MANSKRTKYQSQIPRAYILCRTLRHSWELTDDDRPAPWGKRVTLICKTCLVKRSDLVDKNGEVLTRQYRYPEGYKWDSEYGDVPMMKEWRVLLLDNVKPGWKRGIKERND